MRFEYLVAALPVAFAAPVIVPREGLPIPGKYIVKFKNDVFTTSAFTDAVALLKDEPEHNFNFGKFHGFSGKISDDVVALLKKLPNIEYIEQDAIVKANLGEVDESLEKRAYVSQTGAPWGLARISSRTTGGTTYTYDNSAGAGTCAYIVDTGIQANHPNFGTRATQLVNYAGDGSNTDGNGHGTHVAGTIGSTTYGVAKQTRLLGVKVLNAQGSGSNSGVIAGINYVANDVSSRGCTNGAVANLSLGGSRSTAVNSAAAGVVDAGVFLAVAAGNENQNAANVSPASEPSVYTVGATDSADRKASFSNFGTGVDVQAPGVAILSTWIGSSTRSISGTSMASPHVAGLGAYLLAFEGRRTPAALGDRIRALATANRVTGLPAGTPNYLIFNGNPSA